MVIDAYHWLCQWLEMAEHQKNTTRPLLSTPVLTWAAAWNQSSPVQTKLECRSLVAGLGRTVRPWDMDRWIGTATVEMITAWVKTRTTKPTHVVMFEAHGLGTFDIAMYPKQCYGTVVWLRPYPSSITGLRNYFMVISIFHKSEWIVQVKHTIIIISQLMNHC